MYDAPSFSNVKTGIQYMYQDTLNKILAAHYYLDNLRHKIAVPQDAFQYEFWSFQIQLRHHPQTAWVRFTDWSHFLHNITRITIRLLGTPKLCFWLHIIHLNINPNYFRTDVDQIHLLMNENIPQYCLQNNQTVSLIDPTIYMTRFIAVRVFIGGNGTLMIDLNHFIPFDTLLPQFYVNSGINQVCCDRSMELYYVIQYSCSV